MKWILGIIAGLNAVAAILLIALTVIVLGGFIIVAGAVLASPAAAFDAEDMKTRARIEVRGHFDNGGAGRFHFEHAAPAANGDATLWGVTGSIEVPGYRWGALIAYRIVIGNQCVAGAPQAVMIGCLQPIGLEIDGRRIY